MADLELPVVFHFAVSIAGADGSGADAAFREASGLESEIEIETVTEGGENRFVHRLPKAVKHPNLVLKRGLTSTSSELVKWCKATFENDFTAAITPKSMVVSLRDAEGDPVASWSIDRAYPVKWSVGGFDAMKNEIAVETVEFAYNMLKRSV
ncbi:phage tail protein [Rhodobacteraceae bacterium DSL-40]|uniref:phage tail protein n=1 Tax=Amaricoccus sp. B4 TaxID=3368557 RepID=UPI000DAC724F